jgi:hypothetical protein
MINEKDNPVAWALLLSEIEEVREHLGELASKMSETGSIEDAEFSVDLGHVYAHLNRVWNSHNLEEIPKEQWELYSRFPIDIKPVG